MFAQERERKDSSFFGIEIDGEERESKRNGSFCLNLRIFLKEKGKREREEKHARSYRKSQRGNERECGWTVSKRKGRRKPIATLTPA